MAAGAGRRTSKYETRGNLAYDAKWTRGSAAAPGREEILHPRPRVRPKERILARPRIKIREAGLVSPFAVLGFLAIGMLAVLLVMGYSRLAVSDIENIRLRSELTKLKEEEAKLLAQYELAYDLQAIEDALTADGTMIKPGSNQMVILDLSEPDNVVVYDQTNDSSGVLDKIGSFFENLW